MNRLQSLENGLAKTRRKASKGRKQKTNGKAQEVLQKSLYYSMGGKPKPAKAPPAAPSTPAYTPVNYDVPGIVAELQQPSGMTCWATVTTILYSWREQKSYPIETVLESIGAKWLAKFKANQGLTTAEKVPFLKAAGLEGQGGFNPSIQGWESLLMQYGPLWVTTDEAPGPAWAIHARVITGIHGDGSPAGTKFTIIDPGTGTTIQESVGSFWPKFESEVAQTGNTRIQVVHFAAAAKSLGLRRTRALGGKPQPPPVSPSATPAKAHPWSKYFHFAKGSTYEVDGPAGYDGKGDVRENSGDRLVFVLDMPDYTVPIVGHRIPKALVLLELTYKQEGAGNEVKATVNGQVFTDNNAKITSNDAKNLRTIEPSVAIPGFNLERLSFSPDGSDEIDLDIRLDGSNHDFDLNLQTAKGKSMALGEEANAWKNYVAFDAGVEFKIDGPHSWDGQGRMLENTGARLAFEMRLGETTVMLTRIPPADLLFELDYRKEGPGNRLRLVVNGAAYDDPNATIRSDKERGERTILPSIRLPDIKIKHFRLSSKEKGKVLLSADMDGSERKFVFEKIAQPQAQSAAPTYLPPPGMGAMQPWQSFFPFLPGTNFHVKGTLTSPGNGIVLMNNHDELQFEADIPGLGAVRFAFKYAMDGPSNRARITVNGQNFEDANALIHTDAPKYRRTIRMKIPAVEGHQIQEIAFSPMDSRVIDFDMIIDGTSHDLDFTAM